MSSRFNLLTQQLFQKTISECSIEDLQKLVDDYPYFAPAHFALVKKLQQENSPHHLAELQKAVLYYHTPPLFEPFLNEENYVMDVGFLAVPELPKVDETKEEEITADLPGVAYIPPVVADRVETMPEFPSPEENRAPSEEQLVAKQVAPIIIEHQAEITNDSGSTQALSEMPGSVSEEKPYAEPLAFEPYHTVDYFASQGIKLSQEEATKDALGKQLKSFTEWLKTMKRLPVKEQTRLIDPVQEQKVDTLAAHSVDRAEVHTETMAEVWIAQGNTEKAIETYQKLSLINPSKRAYFAAKVDFLKKEI